VLLRFVAGRRYALTRSNGGLGHSEIDGYNRFIESATAPVTSKIDAGSTNWPIYAVQRLVRKSWADSFRGQ
jgi:hypothetical protein